MKFVLFLAAIVAAVATMAVGFANQGSIEHAVGALGLTFLGLAFVTLLD